MALRECKVDDLTTIEELLIGMRVYRLDDILIIRRFDGSMLHTDYISITDDTLNIENETGCP